METWVRKWPACCCAQHSSFLSIFWLRPANKPPRSWWQQGWRDCQPLAKPRVQLCWMETGPTQRKKREYFRRKLKAELMGVSEIRRFLRIRKEDQIFNSERGNAPFPCSSRNPSILNEVLGKGKAPKAITAFAFGGRGKKYPKVRSITIDLTFQKSFLFTTKQSLVYFSI